MDPESRAKRKKVCHAVTGALRVAEGGAFEGWHGAMDLRGNGGGCKRKHSMEEDSEAPSTLQEGSRQGGQGLRRAEHREVDFVPSDSSSESDVKVESPSSSSSSSSSSTIRCCCW